jgi:hypothetical protein
MKPWKFLAAVVCGILVTGCTKSSSPGQAAVRSKPVQGQPIDLSRQYNGPLTGWVPSSAPGNDLATLPPGLQTFEGMPFEIQGVIQLSGAMYKERGETFPERVENIPVKRQCKALHFLQASSWVWLDYQKKIPFPKGTELGSYAVHYADGQIKLIPILYGKDVADWFSRTPEDPEVTGTHIAWSGTNAFKRNVRLFLSSWQNPLPAMKIESIDYASAMTTASPFLIGITE